MAFEIRDNTFSLFKNDRRENETQAEYTGSAKVAGVEYFVNAWVKETKDGRKYFSANLKPKEQRR